MSTFLGRIQECDWISMDHFQGENLTSKAFFLSHCHQDHMAGLADDAFYEYLLANNLKLYCHSVTKILLEACKKYSRLVDFIETKEYDEPFSIAVARGTITEDSLDLAIPVSANVTFIDAQHCPGSVMILFEFTNGKTVLYTGDLRLTKNDWLSCGSLRNPLNRTGFKHIDSLYFDSTFCRKGTEEIPSKEQSKEVCLKMVREWLDAHPEHKVLIWGTTYGQEFFFRAIYDEFGLKCHVTADKFRIYSKLPEFADCVTCFANSARIHACASGLNSMDERFEEKRQTIVVANHRGHKPQIAPCGMCRPDNGMVRVIRPSVIWFARRNQENAIGYNHNAFCRLVYSNHCSFAEIVDAFKLLRPVQAFPNVIDKKRSEEHEQKIMNYLQRYLYGAILEKGVKKEMQVKEELDIKPIILKRIFEEPGCNRHNQGDEAPVVVVKKRALKLEIDGVKVSECEVHVTVKEEPLSTPDGAANCEDDIEASAQSLSQRTIELSDGE